MAMLSRDAPSRPHRSTGNVQLAFAASDSPESHCTAQRRGEPQRGELEALLATEPSSRRLVDQLQKRCRDPVRALISMLDEAAGLSAKPAPSRGYCELLDIGRRAFEALIVLGTAEAYDYVLSRLERFDSEMHRDLDNVILQHGGEIRTAAARVWSV